MSYLLNQSAPRAAATALGLLAINAFAQMPHNHASMSGERANATVLVAPPASNALHYESIFARYKSYRDEKIGVWRESNETVDRIGGWRAYAKEAQLPDSSSPAKSNPHAGHGAKP